MSSHQGCCCCCHGGIAWGLGYENGGKKKWEFPPFYLSVRDLLLKSELEGFSQSSLCPQQWPTLGFESELSLDYEILEENKTTNSSVVHWYFEFWSSSSISLLFAFQSLAELLHAFCSGFRAAFHGRGRVERTVSILPSELGLDADLCDFKVYLVIWDSLPLGCSQCIPGT